MRLSATRLLIAFGVSAATSASAAAQTPFTFDIDQAQSSWTFGGTTSLGPIQGTPDTFQVAGTAQILLTGGGSPVGTVTFLSTEATTVPDISAIIPNPLPFLPPLATIDVVGAVLSIASDTGTVDGSGFFGVTITPTFTAGTAFVDNPITGTTMIDLTGTQGTATPVVAQIHSLGGGFTIDSGTISDTFDLSDPGSGITGSLDISGSVEADYVCPPALSASPSSISVAAGGSQSFELSTCVEFTNSFYILLGSASGTAPGFPTAAGNLPLNPDAYFNLTLNKPNQPPLTNTFGLLDASGVASASFDLPPGIPGLVGLNLNHAFLALDASFTPIFISNAVPLSLGA
ncbi:MAG: hypothetical protein AAF682_23715 [Planctomycetota bacterium]